MNAVEMLGIVKQYPLVRAVDGVDFTLAQGEIHSLLGENGAGKSTLMKILYGMTAPTAGEIRVSGKAVRFRSSRQAIESGIGMVHQHFMLAPVMTVTENIVAGMEPGKLGYLDRKAAKKQVQAIIDRFGFKIAADAVVGRLSVGEQQRVEVIKSIYRGAEILILDEPTAVLTPQEADELFAIMRELKAAGKSIIIITHKLKETFAIADRISVLRDGKMVQANLPVSEVTSEVLARMMVGRDVALDISRRSRCVGDAALEVRGLTLSDKSRKILEDIAFTVHRGEVLGIAGIEGNGQTELIEVLTGLRKPDAMTLLKDGKPVAPGADHFLESGIGHVPEDRMTRGLVLEMPISDNLILGYHRRGRFQKRGWFRRKAVSDFASRVVEQFQIKTPTAKERVSALSGGNQQKVVIGRVFSENPDVLIAAQPTRGVDIGAMEYIHNRLLDLRDEGKAVLLLSADLDEVRTLSDRLVVLYDGKIVKRTRPEDVDDVTLGLYMTGSRSDADEKEEAEK